MTNLSSGESIVQTPAENVSLHHDSRIAFAAKLARALHHYGTPTHKLEQAMNLILLRLGIEGYFFSTPTGIFPGSLCFGGFTKFIERDVISGIEATFQIRPRTAL